MSETRRWFKRLRAFIKELDTPLSSSVINAWMNFSPQL
jgi:hypothetical protein